MNRRAVLLAALFVGLLAAGSAAVAAPAAAEEMDVEHTVGMADEPGAVDVTTRVFVPSGTTGLRVTIPERTDVYATEGFTQVDERTYEWTRSTDEPTISYTMAGNISVDRGAGERHLFAVTDEWAIVRSPRVGLRTPGERVEANASRSVAGEGVAGPHITYLGPYEERTRTASQRFRLVVPAAADMRASQTTVLDSLEHASGRIPFGARDDEVFVVVAPTTVEWAATGLQRGDADMWVRDVQRVDSPRNAWVHEYVHTRQDYETTEATRWTIEGMAEYYAALLPYETGRIDHEAFRRKLAQGEKSEYADVRLADPETWSANEANYEKGALVFGALDRRLHGEADASMDDVVASFGDGEVDQLTFLEAIRSAGGADVREDAEHYTETTATPLPWSRERHVEAFGGALLRHEFEGFAVSGPYRSTTLVEPRVVTGETVEARVAVTNAGSEAGEFAVEFRVDGETVTTERGTLAAGESRTLSFSRRFDAAGEYELRAGTATATAVVEEPAEPRVTGVTTDPAPVAPGERVRIRATVAAGAARPAAGPVTVSVDGRTVTTERVAFERTTTVEATTTFDSPGEYTVRVGDRTTPVTVQGTTRTRDGASTTPAPTSADGGPSGNGTAATTPSSGAGSAPGVPVAVVAAVAAVLLLRGRAP